MASRNSNLTLALRASTAQAASPANFGRAPSSNSVSPQNGQQRGTQAQISPMGDSQALKGARERRGTATAANLLKDLGKIGAKVQDKMRQKAQLAKLSVLLADDPQTMELVQSLMLPKEERTIQQLTDLRDFMRTTDMLREVADDSILQLEICRCMSLELFGAGDKIIKEGEVGDRAYVLMRGTVGIRQGRATNKLLDTLKPICSFGEIALKADVPRNASCVAIDDGVICATMPRSLYRRYVQSGERREVLRFYKDLFPKSNDQEMVSLSFWSEVKHADRGKILTQAGKSGSRFFFLKKGLCHIVDHNHEQQLEAAQRLVSAPSSDDFAGGHGGDSEKPAPSPSKSRTATGDENDNSEESLWFGAAANWMWDSKHIWTAIIPGDFFGLEAAVSDGVYMNTIVAATECQIIVLPITCWPNAFPKGIRKQLQSTLLQTVDWRKAREDLSVQRPRSVMDFNNQQRAEWARHQSGRATKFLPKRPEMTYTVWKAPERKILRDAEVEEFPEIALMRQTVSSDSHRVLRKCARARQFRMESSVCLQLSPLDLLQPPKKAPQMVASVGFLHQGPKQRGPPGAVHLPSIRKAASMPQLGKESTIQK